MLKKLFCIEKKYRKFAILNTFMDWMNIIIFIKIANIILLTINNQKVSKLFYIMLIFTFIFQLSYYTIWGKNYINIWSNKSKLYLKKMYFKSVLQDYNHYNVVDIIQGDMINLERLDNIYEIIFPAFFRIIFGLIFILLFSILFKSINFLVYILYFFVMGGSIMLFMKSINTVNRVHMNTFLNIGKRFLNDLNGINTLIMYGQDKVFFDDFKKDSENFRQKTMDLLYAQLQTLFILNFYVFLFSIFGVIYNIIQIKLGNISNIQGIILSMILINLLLFT
ncbi:ABC transporter transmembrane domain-containing protein, partial [Helcococcus ovis]